MTVSAFFTAVYRHCVRVPYLGVRVIVLLIANIKMLTVSSLMAILLLLASSWVGALATGMIPPESPLRPAASAFLYDLETRARGEAAHTSGEPLPPKTAARVLTQTLAAHKRDKVNNHVM